MQHGELLSMNNNSNELTQELVKYYEISVDDIINLTPKTYRIYDKNGKAYFLKKTNINTLEKYQFLNNQGINNVLYPLQNQKKQFVTRDKTTGFYINEFFEQYTIVPEVRVQNMFVELDRIHQNTSYKRQLNPQTSRPKFEEITNRLDYKFKLLENYVRSIESKPLNMYSMPILANYQYLLDAKKELVRLQKRIISSIKARESIEYSFVHNNPKISHTINVRGNNYLTSLDNGKIGVESLDFAKFYIENEDTNIDFKMIYQNHFHDANPFYYDYLRYLILVIYISKINITSDSYVNASEFISTSNSIKKYFNAFQDIQDPEDE